MNIHIMTGKKADNRSKWLYKAEPALYEKQFSPEGMINYSDHQMQLYIRKGVKLKDDVIVVCILPK
jgi:hypothetical protein